MTRFSGTFKVNSILRVGQGTRAVNPGKLAGMTKISLLISFTSLWHGTRTSTCVSGGVALSLIDLMFLAESGKEVFSPQCSLISSWSSLRWFEQACAMQMTWFCLLLHLKLWGWCCAVVRILLLIAALSSNPPRFRYLLSPVLHLPHALLAFILVVSHFPFLAPFHILATFITISVMLRISIPNSVICWGRPIAYLLPSQELVPLF